MTGYALAERAAGAVHLGAVMAGAEPLALQAAEPDGAAVQQAGSQLLRYLAEADTIITCGPALASLLSESALLRDARRCLARIVDVREAALLAIAGLPDFALETVCEALSVPPPCAGKPQTLLDRWELLCRRLRERARTLKPDLAGALAAIAGPAWPEAVLGAPEASASVNAASSAAFPRRPRKARRTPVTPENRLEEAAAAFLSPGGPVAGAHPAYEHRPGQVAMAQAIAAAFERQEALLVEAGTGVGKSLAYLVSAIHWARAMGEPVVISTNTKNLQDQLMRRDIPLAARSLGVEFTAAVLKGRANYLCPCLLAAMAERARASVFRDERLAVAHLVAWAAAVPVADVESLSPAAYEVLPALRDAVSHTRARAEACAGRRCAYYESCPVEVARRLAQNADIVVVNHALRLVEANGRILPEHRCLILDEAHNLENVATDQLGLELSDPWVRGLLRLLEGQGAAGPVDRRVAEWLASRPTRDDAGIMEAGTSLREPVAQLEYALEDLAAEVMDFSEGRPGWAGDESGRNTVRLTDETRGTEAWEEVAACVPPVRAAAGAVQAVLRRLAELVADGEEEESDTTAAIRMDIETMVAQLAELQGSLAIVVEGEGASEYVCWVETWPMRGGDTGWALRAAPVDVGPALAEALYRNVDTVVLTSATLTVEESFDYMRRRIGLESERDRLVELTVPSPFDFPDQLLMCVPTDLPLPNDREFAPASQEAMLAAAAAAGGGTLCLFTSRESMARAYSALAARFGALGLNLLCQDVHGTRTALLEALRADPRAVLFGLKSFWEGIDVPGEALRCLVIVKLPFAVPSDPVVEARQERVQEEGLDGYEAYYVPNAIIGFRQGVGRLIRTKTDRGAVLILDRRVLLRRYGPRFLASVPTCRLLRAPLEECIEAVEEMVGGARA